MRGLPPTLTEADLRAHFAKHKDLTDVRLIPNRRIGYIGYKTAEDAQAAVKYFNKSFIRMSKINVEIATSVCTSSAPYTLRMLTDPQVADRAEIPNKNRPMAHDDSRKRQKLSPPTEGADNKLKRKHDDKAVANADAPPNKKFQEFLNVMAPSGKSNTWSNADHADNTGIMPVAETTAEDEEYVDLVPLKTIPQPEAAAPVPVPMPRTEIITTSNEDSQTQEQEPTGPVSDADWLRSRTSRLLDVTDDVSSRFNAADASSSTAIVAPAVASLARPVAQPEVSDVAMTDAAPISNQSELDKAIETISQSGRLFVRNLPYSASEDDLRQHFAAHGELQEVLIIPLSSLFCPSKHPRYMPHIKICWVFGMTNLIGTTYLPSGKDADPLEKLVDTDKNPTISYYYPSTREQFLKNIG